MVAAHVLLAQGAQAIHEPRLLRAPHAQQLVPKPRRPSRHQARNASCCEGSVPLRYRPGHDHTSHRAHAHSPPSPPRCVVTAEITYLLTQTSAWYGAAGVALLEFTNWWYLPYVLMKQAGHRSALFFVCGGMHSHDATWQQGYRLWPLGMNMQVLRRSASIKLDKWAAKSAKLLPSLAWHAALGRSRTPCAA